MAETEATIASLVGLKETKDVRLFIARAIQKARGGQQAIEARKSKAMWFCANKAKKLSEPASLKMPLICSFNSFLRSDQILKCMFVRDFQTFKICFVPIIISILCFVGF